MKLGGDNNMARPCWKHGITFSQLKLLVKCIDGHIHRDRISKKYNGTQDFCYYAQFKSESYF